MNDNKHTPEPIAYRLTNTTYRQPHFEYFTNKEEAERRQFEFNRSVDDGGLYNLTPLWGPEYVQQLERESSACDMVAELVKQRDELLAALENVMANPTTFSFEPIRAAIARATGDDDAALECTCAAKDTTFG